MWSAEIHPGLTLTMGVVRRCPKGTQSRWVVDSVKVGWAVDRTEGVRVGIVTGTRNPWVNATGFSRVRVQVETFVPSKNPYP